MTNDLDKHAGKAPDERHPVEEGSAPDPSDHADLRVAQPGDDPPGEEARTRAPARDPKHV